MKRLVNLSLTSKIVLLVALMGVITLAITTYALASMRSIDRQYRALITHEAQAALRVGAAARHLGDAGRIAYKVLTERDEDAMRDALGDLASVQAQFNAELRFIGMLLPHKAVQLQAIAGQSQQVFALAVRIIDAATRWRGDQALELIDTQFEPAVAALRQNMDGLRNGSVTAFEASSQQLGDATTRTVVSTALAVLLGLLLVMALALYVAVTQISRPIAQLTRTMERLTGRHYDDAIAMTDRRDEVGTMAKALQVFKDSMQRADRLAIEVAASAEARRLSEQLVDLVDAIPGAVFQMHVRPDGWRTTLFLSDKAAQLHSRPLAELKAMQGPAGHGFLRTSSAATEQAHQAYMHALRTLQPIDLDTLTEQGERPRWLKTLATARRTPDGGALFNGVWLDVTEQKQQAQALAQAKKAAERAAAEKATFLATMSHEIRTPLNAILGMTQMALKGTLHPQQRERLEKSLRAGKHLLGIVNDVLDFSKIEAGQMALETTDFALAQLLADVLELYCERASAKGLRMDVHVAPDVPPWLRGDPHRIAQILINYLNNAIKFTDSGAIGLEVQLVHADGPQLQLRCTVRDTGVGIAEAQQLHLFTAFQQADTSITRRFGGTGLGLAISRQLAGLMGGEVGLKSTPGAGSAFWFTAAVQRGTAPHGTALPVQGRPDSAARSLKGLRVLLVDDNEVNLAVASGLLESGGVLVDTATDGAQALALLQAAPDGRYAGVLMDVQMPVLDGMAATRALRQQPRFAALPIVAMTANATAQDIERTRAAGMNAHLSKPILEEALWRTLRPWLAATMPADGQPSSPLNARPDTDSSPWLDTQALHELRAVFAPERLQALAAAFEQDCRHKVDTIVQAAHQQPPDWATLHSASHSLSGSAGSLGLQRLGDVAHTLHGAVRAQDVQATLALVDALQQGAQRSLPQLQAWCNQAPTAAPAR